MKRFPFIRSIVGACLVLGTALAQVPINNLPPATLPLTGNETTIVQQSGVTKKTAVSNITNAAAPLNGPYALVSSTPALTASRVLLGTPNEITLTDGGPLGNLTLSTPQAIGLASTPTFGGITLSSLTGMLVGNGASPLTVYAGTTCGGGQVIQSLSSMGVGTCIAAGASFANPTASVGLTAVNGVATTAMRSDAAPAIDTTIGPTWTNHHTFTPAGSSLGIKINAAANNFGELVVGSSTSSQSRGLGVQAGTNSSDTAFSVTGVSGLNNYMNIFGDGGIQLGAATGGDLGLGTLNATGLFVNNVAVSTTTSTGANPTASVGLSAVNGVATTFLRSDAAPALSQAIAPTWTGIHIFSPSAGAGTEAIEVKNTAGDARLGLYSTATEYGLLQATANNFILTGLGASTNLIFATNHGTALTIAPTGSISVAAPSSGVALDVTGSGASDVLFLHSGAFAHGFTIDGTSATGVYQTFSKSSSEFGYLGSGSALGSGANTDLALRSQNDLNLLSGGANIRMRIASAGTITGLGPTAAALVDMTPDASSYTGTLTGCTTAPTVTIQWYKIGKQVTIYVPTSSCTSNAVTFTVTGAPAAIAPATTGCNGLISVGKMEDSTALITDGQACMNGSGTIFFTRASVANFNAWTASGIKGIGGGGIAVTHGLEFTYLLN